MQRRDFMLRSAGAALLGAIPFGASAALRGPLLEDPLAWLGTMFRLPDGSRIELAGVEPVVGDRLSTQVRLQFRTVSGSAPREGTHVLAAGWHEELLFLQAGREGPVACINRLHRSV
jgi:hypothetical protein